MAGVALPRFVLETTGSPARAGVVAAAAWVPMGWNPFPRGAWRAGSQLAGP